MIENKRLKRIYNGMFHRCYNPNNSNYFRYGYRGIQICDNWLGKVSEFEKWALENGYEEHLTIDRIDNNGNYEPSNCRWATYKQQAQNKGGYISAPKDVFEKEHNMIRESYIRSVLVVNYDNLLKLCKSYKVDILKVKNTEYVSLNTNTYRMIKENAKSKHNYDKLLIQEAKDYLETLPDKEWK